MLRSFRQNEQEPYQRLLTLFEVIFYCLEVSGEEYTIPCRRLAKSGSERCWGGRLIRGAYGTTAYLSSTQSPGHKSSLRLKRYDLRDNGGLCRQNLKPDK